MKKIYLLLLTLFVAAAATAAPVSEEQARRIASEFFAGGTRAGVVEVELAWSGSELKKEPAKYSMQRSVAKDDALLYIYNRSNTPGFVIIAGDDNVLPIVGFSYDRQFDTGNIADGARALLSAWCRQIADAQKGGSPSLQQKLMPSVGSVECLYETALWNQSEPFNNEAPVYEGYRSITGCVATAMSIICYYNKWPENGVGTTPSYTHKDEWNITRTVYANTLGRKYDYNNMLANYNSSYTSTQAAAVAALMYDIGTSVKMSYSPSFSGASSSDVPVALSTYFGYSKSCQLVCRGNKSDKEWFDMLKTNIATYGPTYFSGNDTQSGHAFVLDGYTSGNYFHINYGWGGYGNGYYWIPDIEYFNQQDALFYLAPDKNGISTYTDSISLIPFSTSSYNYYGLSSLAAIYKTGEEFTIIIGGVYNTGNTTFNGDVRVAHCNKMGEVKSNIVTSKISDLPAGYYTRFNPLSVRISSAIEEGDRIRFQYKGAYSSDWQWARGSEADCVDEILLMATPEEVASSLSITYAKSSKSFVFTSPNAIQYTVKSAVDGSVKSSGSVASHTTTNIDLSAMTAGEYLFEFASGGRPYVLRVVL